MVSNPRGLGTLIAAKYVARFRREELPAHKNLETMIYAHVLNRGGTGVRSRADAL